MAHRSGSPLETPRRETKILFAKATGAGAADLVVDASADNKDLESATRTGAGVFDLVFRHKYPEEVCPLSPGVVGTTTGLVAIFTAWDSQAGTATVKFSVGGVATDPAATDLIHFAFVVRNTDRD